MPSPSANFSSSLGYWFRLRFYYCPKYLTGKCDDLCSVCSAVLLINFLTIITLFWKPLCVVLFNFWIVLSCSLALFGFAHWVRPEAERPLLLSLLSAFLTAYPSLSFQSHLCVDNISSFIQAVLSYLLQI